MNQIRDKMHPLNLTLTTAWLQTPLGRMIAIASESALYLLEFFDRKNLDQEIQKLQLHSKATIISGMTPVIRNIETELSAYFEGKLKTFKTPLHLGGSPFQQQVWQALMRIPYGQMRTYSTQAHSIGKPTAFRAVANANGANQLAIVIPCHRIIRLNGGLGGYAGGIARKEWLIAHERKYEQAV